MVALPVDFSALTGTIQASQFDQNFVVLNSKFGQLSSADISPSAGITVSQLAQQYTFRDHVFDLLPHGEPDPAVAASGGGYTYSSLIPTRLTAAPAQFMRRRIRANSGQILYLCEVEIWAEDITVGSGGEYPQVVVYKNGTALPNMTFTLNADDSFFVARYPNPKTDPLFPFVNDDIIAYYVGESSTANACFSRRIQVREHWKEQIGA